MKKKFLASTLILAITLSAFMVSCERSGNNTEDSTINGENADTVDNKDGQSGASDSEKSETQTDNTVKVQTESDSKAEKINEGTKNDGSTENKDENDSNDSYYYVGQAYSGSSFEIVEDLFSSEHAIFTTDGEHFGICGINGEVLAEPVYTVLGWCPWHEVIYAEPFPEGTEPIVISEKLKIDVHYGHGGGGLGFYVYDVKRAKMLVITTDIECFWISEVDTVPTNTPYILYEGEEVLSEGDINITQEEYGKVEKLIFGKAKYEYITENGNIVELGECESCGEFTNGYMTVKRDGALGFVDSSGNPASQFIYTDAKRAFDGKAWVKSEDGLWRVVELK